MAIGLLFALRERRIRVPEDMALAGFDDIPIARYLTPPLSTVRVSISELGSHAVKRMLQILGMEKARRPYRQETLPTTLVVRRSCGAGSRGGRGDDFTRNGGEK